MSVSAFPYGTIGAGAVDPEVSPRLDGATNSRLDNPCYAGFQIQNDGDEYEYSAGGGLVSLTTWLDAGIAADVWMMWTRTGGTLGDWDSLGAGNNNVRLNCATTRSFRLVDTVSSGGGGAETIIGYTRWYDAATGGNLLHTSSTVTWSARRWHDTCPLCCFTPFTLITMADGTTQPIISVKVGDLIMVEGGIESVKEVITRTNRPMYRLAFTDGIVLEASEDHPLYVDGKGYSAVNPDPSIDYKDLGVAELLTVGDMVRNYSGGYSQVDSIEPLLFSDTVYTFSNSRFYANGLLVY